MYRDILSRLASNKIAKSSYLIERLRSGTESSGHSIVPAGEKSTHIAVPSPAASKSVSSPSPRGASVSAHDTEILVETIHPFHTAMPRNPSPSSSRDGGNEDRIEEDASNHSNSNNPQVIRALKSISHFPFLQGTAHAQKIRDVFLEIVEDDRTDEEAAMAALSEKRLFWKRMSDLNAGSLKFTTYNGMCVINKRKQARVFAEKLYQHLSRRGQYELTARMIRDLLVSAMEASYRKEHIAPEDEAALLKAFEEAKKETIKQANLMFLLGDKDDAIVKDTDILAGVMKAYKEMKFASSSLYDFGELQLTLRYVVDVFFWICMLIIFQCIVQFNITTILAPAITVVLILSFALGPFFGNMFLCIAFVLFMLPFDIGNRVMIGVGPNAFVCYITGIGLFYTTVETIYNEKVRHNLR
jgi:hypothetical protein